MSRSAASSCSLVNSGGEPLPLSCSASFATLFLATAMANPADRGMLCALSIPTQSVVEGLLDGPTSLALPHCSAARNFRDRFRRFLKSCTVAKDRCQGPLPRNCCQGLLVAVGRTLGQT